MSAGAQRGAPYGITGYTGATSMGMALGALRSNGEYLLAGAGGTMAIGLIAHGMAGLVSGGDPDDESTPAEDAATRGRAYTSLTAISLVAGGAALGAAGLAALVGKTSSAVGLLGVTIGAAGTAGTVAAMRGAVDVGFGARPSLPNVTVQTDDR